MNPAKLLLRAVDLKKQGHSPVLVTVMQAVGSTPRGIGAQMLVREDGEIIGTVGGGVIEARAKQAALEMLADNRSVDTLTVDLTGKPGETGADVCGGQMTVLLESIE